MTFDVLAAFSSALSSCFISCCVLITALMFLLSNFHTKNKINPSSKYKPVILLARVSFSSTIIKSLVLRHQMDAASHFSFLIHLTKCLETISKLSGHLPQPHHCEKSFSRVWISDGHPTLSFDLVKILAHVVRHERITSFQL
jgi:hypothetical protein